MKHLLKPTLILTICTFLGQIVSFLVNVISAKILGASVEMDAYIATQTLPNFISVVLLGGLGYVFIPTFIEYKTKDKENEAWTTANTLIVIYVGLLGLLAIGGIVWTKPLLKLLVPGFNTASITLAQKLSAIIWPTTILSGLLAILTSLYHAYERFIYQAVATVISGCIYVVILLAFGNKQNAVYALSYGLLISSALNVFFLVKILGKRGKNHFNFRSKAVYSIFLLQLPIILASACSNATRLFDRYFASSLQTGTISYLTYADKVKLAIAAVLGGGISVTIFPLMAKNFSRENTSALKNNISLGLIITSLIVMPIIVACSVLAIPFVRILFERGEFTSTDTLNVSYFLPWFLLSIIGATMANVTARAFYVLKQTKIVAGIAILEILLYVFYMPLLCKKLEGVGIAIAVMILWNSSFLTQFVILDVKYKLIERRKVLIGVSKITAAALISALVLKSLLAYFFMSDLVTLLLGGIIYVMLYLILVYLFKVREYSLIVSHIHLPNILTRKKIV